MSEKKQINKDQIVQDYTRSLVEFYNESKILPVQVIDNLFEQEHSNKIKNLILDYEKKNPVGMDSNIKAWASDYETHQKTNIFSNYLNPIVQYSQSL